MAGRSSLPIHTLTWPSLRPWIRDPMPGPSCCLTNPYPISKTYSGDVEASVIPALRPKVGIPKHLKSRGSAGQEVELPGCQANLEEGQGGMQRQLNRLLQKEKKKKAECNGGSNSLRHASPNKPLDFAAVFNVQASHPYRPHIQLARNVLRTAARPSQRPPCPRPHATPDLAQQAHPNSPQRLSRIPPRTKAARCPMYQYRKPAYCQSKATRHYGKPP